MKTFAMVGMGAVWMWAVLLMLAGCAVVPVDDGRPDVRYRPYMYPYGPIVNYPYGYAPYRYNFQFDLDGRRGWGREGGHRHR